MSEDETRNLRAEDKLDLILQRLGLVEERLSALEAKSYDMRPIWERALAELAETRQEMNQRFERLEKEMRLMNRKFDEVVKDHYTLRADMRKLEERLTDLERPRQ
ncbi:MAG TPA: hypothetical protein VFD58_36110 [Blastocatellia bacterium]|nr:hypothetical protein [Blastocatellia bacterium]